MLRARRALVRTIVVAALAAGGLVHAAVPASAVCANAFGGSFASQLAQRYPGVRVTAAVYDTRTGCWHHLNRDLQLTTASVIKAQVLGAVLLKAQDEGRDLTAWERSQISPMIRLSFNDETSSLYGHLGSWGGIGASDRRFGVTRTAHVRPFGLTRSTAVDRTNVALRLLHTGSALTQSRREVAWAYMSSVHPLQEWGISAGVPHGWTVAQKNGFYPASGLGWRVGSSGFVREDTADQGYGITVMTEGATTQATGIRLVEEVSRRAAATLAVGPGATRPIDRARCVTAGSGESWSGVTARLGLPSSRAGEVRTVAGGNASPLYGQMACSPDVPAERRDPSSTVNGYYHPASTNLDCAGGDDLLWYTPPSGGDTRWAGHSDRRFRSAALSAGGDLIPVTGDFDGDGCGDVLWYGPGTRPDAVWSGSSRIALNVSGLGYAPVAGDFDADGYDDILWYRPGAGVDYLWFGTAVRGRFTSSAAFNVRVAYEPVVADLDGDGADDVYWYARGPAAEVFWRGQPGVRSFAASTPPPVNNAYRPVSGDLDGDGADEILWYAPGPALDHRWDGLPTAITSTTYDVRRDYLPFSADYDGDGRDDIAWYGPGGLADAMWWGRTDGSYDSGPLRAL